MNPSEGRDLRDARRRLSRRSLLAKAERFVALFHAENHPPGSYADRMRQIRREIASEGTYQHTEAELTFAAQVAWRNSARCIGRLYWRSLRVRDRRHLSSAAAIAAESVAHLRAATNVRVRVSIEQRVRPAVVGEAEIGRHGCD